MRRTRIFQITLIVSLFIGLTCWGCVNKHFTEKVTDEHVGLKISIQTDKESYLIAEKIIVTLTMSNFSSKDLDFRLNNNRVMRGAKSIDKVKETDGKTKSKFLGLISKNYKEGTTIMPTDTLYAFTDWEDVHIKAGESIRQYFLHLAKEPGTVTLVAHLFTVKDQPATNWQGSIWSIKQIEVKDAIKPDVEKFLNDSEQLLLSAKSSEELMKILEGLHRIGYPAKNMLLKLLHNPALKQIPYCSATLYTEVVDILSTLTAEAFDEQVYRELMEIACDIKNPLQVRFDSMWEGKNFHFIRDIKVIIPPEFEKWMYQQIAGLRQDKEPKIREKAAYILEGNKDTLKQLGLEDLLK